MRSAVAACDAEKVLYAPVCENLVGVSGFPLRERLSETLFYGFLQKVLCLKAMITEASLFLIEV